jgi:hypothetical protein
MPLPKAIFGRLRRLRRICPRDALRPDPTQEVEETQFITRLTAVAYVGAKFVVTIPVKRRVSREGMGHA